MVLRVAHLVFLRLQLLDHALELENLLLHSLGNVGLHF
jgi:hypothetical protein